MSDILINGTFAPNGAFPLARSENIQNTSVVVGATTDDALATLNKSVYPLEPPFHSIWMILLLSL
jgi:hypothetical protein